MRPVLFCPILSGPVLSRPKKGTEEQWAESMEQEAKQGAMSSSEILMIVSTTHLGSDEGLPCSLFFVGTGICCDQH